FSRISAGIVTCPFDVIRISASEFLRIYVRIRRPVRKLDSWVGDARTGKPSFHKQSCRATLPRTPAHRNPAMAKAYWVATYRSISNPDALAGYAKLAGPAIQAAGGRFLARGSAVKAYEAGLLQRVVIIEFDSVDKASAAHDSAG